MQDRPPDLLQRVARQMADDASPESPTEEGDAAEPGGSLLSAYQHLVRDVARPADETSGRGDDLGRRLGRLFPSGGSSPDGPSTNEWFVSVYNRLVSAVDGDGVRSDAPPQPGTGARPAGGDGGPDRLFPESSPASSPAEDRSN